MLPGNHMPGSTCPLKALYAFTEERRASGGMVVLCVRVARLHQTIGTSCSGSIRFDTRLLLGA